MKLISFRLLSLIFLFLKIYYYFLIPIFAFVLSCFKRTWHLLIISTIYVGYMCFLQRSVFRDNFSAGSPTAYYFFVMYLGSLVAYIFKRFEDFKVTNVIKSFPFLDSLLGFLCFVVLVVGMRAPYSYGERDFFRYGNFWSMYLLLMLVSAPNLFSKWMGNAFFMRQFGKFSFGAYLFHQMSHRIVAKYQFFGFYTFTNGIDRLIFAIFLTFLFGISFHFLVESRMMSISKYLISKINRYFDVPPIVSYSAELQKDIVIKKEEDN